ncbi:MAG: MraY family glycosyltransferase [Candidatus Omnitrophota bacterium]
MLIGFLLGLVFIYILNKISKRNKLLMPKGIPLVGGIGMGLSFIFVSLLVFLVNKGLSKEIVGIIISSSVMLAFGVFDDWRELTIGSKFLMQIIATGVLVLFGVRTRIVYIGDILNIVITFIWVLGITNAFNHLDIMDGLASGVAIIVSGAFFAVSIFNVDIRSAILYLILIGAVLSFFLYNRPPAKIYMGNAGSHWLGFILAAMALIISYAPLERKTALLSPVLILGLPIFDTTFLVLIRLINKSLPFKKSNDHLVLRFLDLGYAKKKTLFVMFSLCLFFCLCGITASRVPIHLGAGIIVFAALVSLIIGIKMSKTAVNG